MAAVNHILVPHFPACINFRTYLLERKPAWDFPSGPVIKTLPSGAGGVALTPGRETKVPHAMGCSKKIK